jgi:pimeloyl-ACP methyl ester carboxylesterase
VLGVGDFFGGVAGDIIGDIVLKRVVQVIKSPFEQSLNNAIRQAEGPPYAVAFRNGLQPIQGFEAWRTLLPPGGERRVLLFIHGFGSTIANNHLDKWISPLTEGYDAVLGYNHPTISRDPLDNARDLLEMIPEDLRLSVDLIAHSRGGLVARSLVELADARDCFNPRTLITNGTPHAGTRLADPERWDRLVSIGMTAASWLAAATGAAIWIPKVLEFVLKAAAQTVFDLPGIGAMTPGGAFLSKLNASAESSSMVAALQERVHYATVTSRFSIFGVEQPGFQQAFRTFAAQAFLDMPNDLVVPTESMNAIDQMGFVPKDRQLRVATDHFSYFDDAQVIEFIQQQLRR